LYWNQNAEVKNMSLPNNFIDQSPLEELLQQKLEQFEQAETEGKPHQELIQLYKELKDLRYRITVSGRDPGSRIQPPRQICRTS
jgi:hypothetical protein